MELAHHEQYHQEGKKVSQICQEPKPTVIGIGQLRNRVFHSSVFVCEDGGHGVAFLGFCPSWLACRSASERHRPTTSYWKQSNGFRLIQGDIQTPESPLPYCLLKFLCKVKGLILIRSKTRPYGCFQKNLPPLSVFFWKVLALNQS